MSRLHEPMALSKRHAEWCVGFLLLEHHSGGVLRPLSATSSSCTFINETGSSEIQGAAQEDRGGPFPCLGLHVCSVPEEGTSAGLPVFSSVPFFATHEPHSCDQIMG